MGRGVFLPHTHQGNIYYITHLKIVKKKSCIYEDVETGLPYLYDKIDFTRKGQNENNPKKSKIRNYKM